jgi:hypothetical protein
MYFDEKGTKIENHEI